MILEYFQKLVKTAEQAYLRNLYQAVDGLEAGRFLDVGCYDGVNTIKMAKAVRATLISGLEIDKSAIKIAKRRGIGVIAQDLSSARWQVPGNSYDFVYSNQVIEHLYSVDDFLTNIKRVLVKHGYALISTENLSSWHNVFALSLGYQPFSYTNICLKVSSLGNPLSVVKNGQRLHPAMLHRALFTHYSLRELLKAYNFEIVKEINSLYYPLPHYLGNKLAKIDKRHSVYIAYLVRNLK